MNLNTLDQFRVYMDTNLERFKSSDDYTEIMDSLHSEFDGIIIDPSQTVRTYNYFRDLVEFTGMEGSYFLYTFVRPGHVKLNSDLTYTIEHHRRIVLENYTEKLGVVYFNRMFVIMKAPDGPFDYLHEISEGELPIEELNSYDERIKWYSRLIDALIDKQRSIPCKPEIFVLNNRVSTMFSQLAAKIRKMFVNCKFGCSSLTWDKFEEVYQDLSAEILKYECRCDRSDYITCMFPDYSGSIVSTISGANLNFVDFTRLGNGVKYYDYAFLWRNCIIKILHGLDDFDESRDGKSYEDEFISVLSEKLEDYDLRKYTSASKIANALEIIESLTFDPSFVEVVELEKIIGEIGL